MSLINDLLILTDYKNKINLDQACEYLPKSKKQLVSSVLGRLTAKNLLSKTNTNYEITSYGKNFINSVLDAVKQFPLKDYEWKIILFNIPEKLRSDRDRLRNFLQNNGFGKLHDSIWCIQKSNSNELDNLVKLLKLQKYITILDTHLTNNKELISFVGKISWNWDKLNSQYVCFINDTKKFLTQQNKHTYQARILVFTFAKILLKDPKLPTELIPTKKCLTHQAYQYYLKLRKYCY